MPRYYAASVGNVDAFRQVDGKLEHFFSSQTLTDSAIGTSVSGEEIRGGLGAQLLGMFYHTSAFTVSMTDVLFDINYLAAQVGGTISRGGIVASDVLNLNLIPDPRGTGGTNNLVLVIREANGNPMPSPVLYGKDPIVWFTKAGVSEYISYADGVIEADPDNAGKNMFVIPVPGAELIPSTGDACIGANCNAYCVQYYTCKPDAQKLIVSANFIPSELVLLISFQLFAAEAAVVSGKPVGTVTVRVPRFQLDGAIDLALAMSSAATVALNGSALAYREGCGAGNYAEIVIDYAIDEYDGFTSLIADGDALAVGDTVKIFAYGCNKTPKLVDNAFITFVSDPADLVIDGVIQTGAEEEEISMTFKAMTGSFEVDAAV